MPPRSCGAAAEAKRSRTPSAPPRTAGDSQGIPTRILGKTGRAVTILGLGGAGPLLSGDRAAPAVELIRRAHALGITYFDTAHNYADGAGERHYGEALAGLARDGFFLTTKIFSRGYAEARADIAAALDNLRLDHVDCLMLHGLDSVASVRSAFAENGAIHALQAARDEGRTTFVGLSGHANPDVLEAAMARFDFDVVLMAINPADSRRLPFERRCHRAACDAGLGVVHMKVFGGANGRMVDGRGGPYTAEELLRYTWSLRGHAAILGVESIEEIEYAVEAAKRFAPLTRERKREMESRAAGLEIAHCVGFRGPMQ